MPDGFFSVTLRDQAQKEVFRGIAMSAGASVHSNDESVLFSVGSAKADQFEQAVRQLVGTSNYRRYKHAAAGLLLVRRSRDCR